NNTLTFVVRKITLIFLYLIMSYQIFCFKSLLFSLIFRQCTLIFKLLLSYFFGMFLTSVGGFAIGVQNASYSRKCSSTSGYSADCRNSREGVHAGAYDRFCPSSRTGRYTQFICGRSKF